MSSDPQWTRGALTRRKLAIMRTEQGKMGKKRNVRGNGEKEREGWMMEGKEEEKEWREGGIEKDQGSKMRGRQCMGWRGFFRREIVSKPKSADAMAAAPQSAPATLSVFPTPSSSLSLSHFLPLTLLHKTLAHFLLHSLPLTFTSLVASNPRCRVGMGAVLKYILGIFYPQK